MYLVPTYLLTSYRLDAENNNGTAKSIQWTLLRRLKDLDFADDVSLLSHTMGHMQAKTERLQYCQDSRSRDQCHKDQEHVNKCKPGTPPHF